jgi:hypothetical protein
MNPAAAPFSQSPTRRLPIASGSRREPFDGIDGTTKLRRYLVLQQIDAAHARLAAALADPTVRGIVDDFAMKGDERARGKALGKLKAAFRDARLEWATTNKPPIATWSFLKCRDAASWTEADDHPRDRQKCVCMYYLIAGRLPNGSHLATGRWSVEVSYHALARLCSPQRSPLGLTAAEAIGAAHGRLLRSSVTALFDHEKVLLDIGDGSFVVEHEIAEFDGQPVCFVLARTWLASHLPTYLLRLPPAAELSDVAGAVWLCPPPLRKYRADGKVDIPAALAAWLAP